VTLRLDGGEESFHLDPGKSILEGALEAGADPPHVCLGGVCGECRARLSAGAVVMDHDFALEGAELDAGYVLACQSHPTSPAVTLDYDS
jgi:ring-1,2-phenylacetyl-CoA epoxidase subunit PaaE